MNLNQFFTPTWAAELLVRRHFPDLGARDTVCGAVCAEPGGAGHRLGETGMTDATRDHNRPKTYSMCMNIEGFMRNNRYPRGYDIFQNDDGTELTPAEALTFLTTEKAKGHTVIPCSSECGNPCKHAGAGCTGFDYAGGGCPGRYSQRNPEVPA